MTDDLRYICIFCQADLYVLYDFYVYLLSKANGRWFTARLHNYRQNVVIYCVGLTTCTFTR